MATALSSEIPGQPLERPFPRVVDVLAGYDVGTAVIRFRRNGQWFDWPVGIAEADTIDTLREHLSRYLPDADFVGAVMKKAAP